MIKGFLIWNDSASQLPEQGRAVVWKGLHGETVHGCVSYRSKRRVFGPDQMIAEWLPLRDDKFHRADVAIKYLPSLWRYTDGQELPPGEGIHTNSKRDKRRLFAPSRQMD